MILADRRRIAVCANWMLAAPQSYAFALAAVLTAGVLQHLMEVYLGFTHPFILFYPIILLSSLWSSLGVAISATLASALVAEYFFLAPTYSFVVEDSREILGLAVFALVASAISVIGDQFRRRTQRLQEFEKAIEDAEEMIVVLDRDYRYQIANRMFLSYFGQERQNVLGRQVSEVMGTEAFQKVLKPRLDECFDGNIVRFEMQHTYPHRGERNVLANYLPVQGAGGIERITVILQDVTEKKRTEEALQRREEDYRQFVARSSEGIFREELAEPLPIDLPEDELIQKIRRDSYITECNDALAKMYGFGCAAEMIGKRLGDMLVPDDPENLELMREYIRGGFRIVERYSREVDQQGNLKVFRNSMDGVIEEGKLVRTWGIQSDVTEQVRLQEAHRKAEEGLKASEGHFRELVEQASDGIFISDAEGRYTDVNSSGAEMLGYTREEVLQLSISDVVIPEDTLRIGSEVSRFSAGDTIRSGWTFRRKDGSSFPGEVAGRQLADGRLQGILRDMTERELAEQAMRRNEERFRVALKDSPITVFNQDRDLRFTWVYNPHFVDSHEVIGKTDVELLGPKAAARITQLKQAVLKTGLPLRDEVALSIKGKSYAFDITLEPLFDANGKVIGITGASMDIAKLREMADHLLETKEALIREKTYLKNEIRSELGFENIIGQSPILAEVLNKASVVAPTNSTVLLLGETGTGKELVARSVHDLSLRRDKNFVKLNCAAVPSGLLESELFGHEKGAFTSAVSQKLGRIELADKGTLLLDEIGELPLELQPKLLRILQDGEFERLGGVRTLRVDVRIIAATNRDLLQEVFDKNFREDLFYRLNVFPLHLPALRERRGDIPMLVDHFVQKHSKKMGKHIDVVPPSTVDIFENWNWPGNIRELENMIERMVIMTSGRVLAPPPAELEATHPADNSLTEVERDHIIRVLRETNGVLSGTAGAASRLGLKRTTLQSMLKRFNIQQKEYRRGGNGTYRA